jgi:hypothetical protein
MDPIQNHILPLNESIALATGLEKTEYLFAQQTETWPMARNHYRQFTSVERRSFEFDGFRIDLQHNPARARSTCADLSKQNIDNRRCFLCAAHLPEEQKGFVLLNKYLLLVNPFPIFHRHFTISSFHHKPQNIDGHIGDMLNLARELEGLTLFYNGPKCGASAPDHLHFQAVPFGEMPIDHELQQVLADRSTVLFSDEEIHISQVHHYLRETILLESISVQPMAKHFDRIMHLLPEETEWGEPMINVLASFVGGHYRMVIFPRKAQRPGCFYQNDEKRIMVSPASVELGGMVVTPRGEDFNKITREDLITIFKEVSLPFPE